MFFQSPSLLVIGALICMLKVENQCDGENGGSLKRGISMVLTGSISIHEYNRNI